MDREILFRGWREFDGKAGWVYGYYSLYDNRPSIFNGLSFIEVQLESVGQYTGYKDGVGLKIFEKDILGWDDTYQTIPFSDALFTLSYPKTRCARKEAVIFKKGQWVLDVDDEVVSLEQMRELIHPSIDDVIIYGNTFENPNFKRKMLY